MVASSWQRWGARALGWGTVTAILLTMFFFLLLPVGVIIFQAFFPGGELSLTYFSLLWGNSLYTDSIINSVNIGIATTILSTIISLPLAAINARCDYRFKGILGGLLLVPMIMPPFVGAIGMLRFFARRGTLNTLLLDMGLIDTPIEWLGASNMFWAVIILEALHLYPIMYLNLTAALANVDPSMDEAAQTAGAPWYRRFIDITWPLARPGYFAGAIIIFIWAVTDLGTPLLIGYHDTVPVQIFNTVTDAQENPIGYALVFIVIIVTVALFLISKTAISPKKYQMMARGHVTSAVKKVQHRGALALIYICFLTTTIVALIPHIGVVLTSLTESWFMTAFPEQYTLSHYKMVFVQELPSLSIKNSLMLSALATIFDLILGILIAFIVTRRLIPFANVLDSIAMIPLALPGIVLAFGYIVTYTDTVLDPLTNPIPILVIAYGIRRLPFMVRSAVAGFEQTNVSLEEASYTFGASRLQTIVKITAPLITANLIAGALLCFSYAMLDVSDSLILAMKEHAYPMTKAIYVLFLEQESGEFLASALGVIGMLILSTCIIGASLVLGKKIGELFRA